MKIVTPIQAVRVLVGILTLAWFFGYRQAPRMLMGVILVMALIMLIELLDEVSIANLLARGVLAFQTAQKLVVGGLILAWLFGYQGAQSALMGVILVVVLIKVVELRDRISIFDLLAGGVLSLIAVSVTRHIPLASGLTGIVLGLIVTSYILAPGSPNLRQPLGRMMGILLAVLGGYFVSSTWEELVAGLVVGVLLTGLFFGVQKQPQSTVGIIHS
ncbi:MAG TPA: hypothetical protein VI636_07875 [Candidatus Angelobacter sp.]